MTDFDGFRHGTARRWGGPARGSLARAASAMLLLSACATACRRSPTGEILADASPKASTPPSSTSVATESAASIDGSVPAVVTSVSGTDVVSNASTGWKAGPQVVTSGEVDGAALRSRTKARIKGDSSAVTLLENGTPFELGERLCKTVVPARPKETPVLVKPNLGGFEWFKDPAKNQGDDGLKGRITDPEFVRGIVRCLKARGHDKITIAEGWGAKHADWEKLVKVSGYAAMAREEKVALVAMDDDGVFDVEGDQPGKPLKVRGMEKTHAPTLLMPKILAEHLEHGLFISAPKLKAHRFGVVSVGIKGGQGVVMLSDAAPAYNQKWRMHKELGDALKLLPRDPDAGKKAYLAALEVFAERMADVLEVAAPHVVLAEGAPAEGGDGFAKRWPSVENVAIGGTNPILVDRVAAAFLGLWDNADLARELGGHKTSPLIEVAAKRFGVDMAAPVVTGDGAELLTRPRPVHFVSMSGFTIHSDGTSAEVAPGVPPRAARGSGVLRPEQGADVGPGGAGPGTPVAPADATKDVDAEGRPRVHAMHLDGPITVDGLVDSAWNGAPAVAFDTDWSGAKTPTNTRVRTAWAKDAIYMLWELDGAGLNVDATRPVKTEREKLYEEDCVEVFLGPDASNRKRYFEIEVGPLGHYFDIAIDRTTGKTKSDTGWSSQPEIATKLDRARGHVVIEMAVRSPDVVAALTRGAKLPFALYRMEGKAPRSYLAWSPTRTTKPNFHVPETFGTLVLE